MSTCRCSGNRSAPKTLYQVADHRIVGAVGRYGARGAAQAFAEHVCIVERHRFALVLCGDEVLVVDGGAGVVDVASDLGHKKEPVESLSEANRDPCSDSEAR